MALRLCYLGCECSVCVCVFVRVCGSPHIFIHSPLGGGGGISALGDSKKDPYLQSTSLPFERRKEIGLEDAQGQCSPQGWRERQEGQRTGVRGDGH